MRQKVVWYPTFAGDKDGAVGAEISGFWTPAGVPKSILNFMLIKAITILFHNQKYWKDHLRCEA